MPPQDPADPDAPVQQAQAGIAPPPARGASGGSGGAMIGRARSTGLRRWREGGVMAFLGASGLFTLLTTVAIVAILSRETYRFFQFHELAIRDVDPGRPLAGTFERDDGRWRFALDPSQRGEVGFVTREQFERLRAAGDDDAAKRSVLGLAPDAALPPRLVTVYVGDAVRMPAPGRGGIEPVSAEAQELEAAEEQAEREQQEADAADAPGAKETAAPAADVVAEPAGPAERRSVDVDDYAAFGVAGVALDHLALDGGPAEPTPRPVVASVWHDVVSVGGFLTGLTWSPLLGSEHTFGILPLVCGTLLVTAIAMCVALPLGLITAIYLSEYAPPRVRSFLKPTLEILAGVPTVVFGFFALTVITPTLRSIYGGFGVYNAAAAGIAVGILTLPIVTSLIEDALRAVPRSLREASYGLGATRVETSLNVVVPGRPVGHRRRGPAGDRAGGGRDDDRRPRRRRDPPAAGDRPAGGPEPRQRDPAHDRLHGPDLPRRREQLRPRIPVELRRRRDPVRHHARADGRRPPGPRPLHAELRVTPTSDASMSQIALPSTAPDRDDARAARPARARSRQWRATKEKIFLGVCLVAACGSLGVLAVLLGSILLQGTTYLSWDFLRGTPSRFPAEAGIWPATVGTVMICTVCALTAIPIGVATAVLLEEFRPHDARLRRLHGFVQLNITNLAGVPSIVYGILGLTVFVQAFNALGTPNDPAAAVGVQWFDRYLTEGKRLLFVPVADKSAPPTDPASLAAAGAFRTEGGEPVDVELVDREAFAPKALALDEDVDRFGDAVKDALAADGAPSDAAGVAAVVDAEWQRAGLRADLSAVRPALVEALVEARAADPREGRRVTRRALGDVETAEAQARYAGVLMSDAVPGRVSETRPWYARVPFGRSVLAGGLTLMLVVLPVVIISSQEALRAVPGSLRQASLALGATPWQTVRRTTLPSAVPGIMTGTILAMSRAIGEAAPILVIAGIVYITFTPRNLMDDFTAMPLQIFDWASRPSEEFHRVAASGILILLSILLVFNGTAVLIRHRAEKRS